MERKEFEALVVRMEALERANPHAYRRRVLAWAAMGYGYLLLVVLGLLVICALLVYSLAALKWVALKLLFFVVPGLFVLLRSLWVKFDPPAGERVTRREVPQLFALLDDLQSRLKTPRVHEVVVIPELNAAVTQVPRLGFLGWHRNFLLLGLPLMKGLTVEQFTAVLAHELGHLSRGHARTANWIYRLRQIWSRLDAEFAQQKHAGSSVIRRFFSWYAPRFNATSFPLARANEFEADAASVRLTSSTTAAQALTGVSVLSHYLEESYWPSIHGQAKDAAQPGFSPYRGFAGHAVLEVPEVDRERWQTAAMARETSYADTHPSLHDRLAAVGAPASFVPPSAGQGADQLLGGKAEELEQRFDEEWRQRILPSWQEFHAETKRARTTLLKLREQSAVAPLGEGELLEWASAEERVGDGSGRALELRREAHARFPESCVVQFVLGRQLLLSRDGAGESLLCSAMEKDISLELAGAEILRDYHWQMGDKDQAHSWHEKYIVAAQRSQAAQQERNVLLTSDTYLPHGISEEALAPIMEQLRQIPNLKRVYLVRKLTQHYSDQPFYVLGFACAGFLELRDEHKNAAALEEIRTRVNFPAEAIIISVERPNKAFAKLFKKLKGSRIV